MIDSRLMQESKINSIYFKEKEILVSLNKDLIKRLLFLITYFQPAMVEAGVVKRLVGYIGGLLKSKDLEHLFLKEDFVEIF